MRQRSRRIAQPLNQHEAIDAGQQQEQQNTPTSPARSGHTRCRATCDIACGRGDHLRCTLPKSVSASLAARTNQCDPATWIRVGDVNRHLVQSGDACNQCQAKAAAWGMAAVFCPIEAAQYILAMMERDPRTGIRDLNALAVVVGKTAHTHLAARRRELQRIVHQIADGSNRRLGSPCITTALSHACNSVTPICSAIGS